MNEVRAKLHFQKMLLRLFRHDPGTGVEAFFAACIPLILLVLGVITLLVNRALTAPERRPPPGAMQIVDGELPSIPASLRTHTHRSPADAAALPRVLEAMEEAACG